MAKKLEGYSLLFLETAIIFLNTLAIIVISRFKTKYNPDILIFTLAVADLLKAIIPLNMTLVAYLGDKAMVEGEPSCYIFGWTAFTLNSGIMLVMTVMAIDRYIAICWPFEYKHFLSKKRLVYTIIAVFLFSGTHSALPLVRVGRMRSYYNGSFCHFDFDSTIPANLGYNIFVLVLGTSMLMVVIFCYTRAMFSVRGLIKRQRRMSTSTRDIDGADKKRQSTNHMFARLMIVMMMAFCLSWLLFLVSCFAVGFLSFVSVPYVFRVVSYIYSVTLAFYLWVSFSWDLSYVNYLYFSLSFHFIISPARSVLFPILLLLISVIFSTNETVLWYMKHFKRKRSKLRSLKPFSIIFNLNRN